MDPEELLKMLLDNLNENGNLGFTWCTNPNDFEEGYVLTDEEGIFIVNICKAKVEVVE